MTAPATRSYNLLNAISHLPPGGVLTLEDVSWEDYERLLGELGEQTDTRVTFDRGRLEIMSPSDWHDYYKLALSSLVEVLTEELGLEYVSFGSTTFKKQAQAQGTEPDNCFYITNAPQVIGATGLDFEHGPPPDLALEVDIWHQSLSKFPIYVTLGVPEIWRYRKGRMHFYQLQEGAYVEVKASPLFPFLTAETLSQFLPGEYIRGFNQLKREFRTWVRANKPA